MKIIEQDSLHTKVHWGCPECNEDNVEDMDIAEDTGTLECGKCKEEFEIQ